MDFLLFTFYLIITAWLVLKTPFFRKLQVPKWVLVLLFLLKVAAGVYYGWFFTHMSNYKVQADTWRMYYESLVETNWIKSDPAGFVTDLFSPRYQGTSGGILATSHSYWNDIKSVLVVKLMAVCNLLSGGRYYVNLIFFEYLSFFGPVALSRLFFNYYPAKKWYIIGGAFLFPSTLLWCSGFHKEGLLLASLAMATWLVHQLITKKTSFLPSIFLLLFQLLIIFLLRNYLAFFFIIWCIPWLIAYHYPSYKWAVFGVTALICIGAFFTTSYLKSVPDLPRELALRQQEFLKIGGESLIQPQPLQSNFKSYASIFSDAVVNGFFQPLPWKIKKVSYLPAAAEIVAFILLLMNSLYFLIKRRRNLQKGILSTKNSTALLLFCSFFCLSVFLLTGYTIPYLGAIVRYKSAVWPFVILPLVIFLPNFNKNIIKNNMNG